MPGLQLCGEEGGIQGEETALIKKQDILLSGKVT